MKNIYIGDIHGRDIWKKIVIEHNDADNIVFVGDYLDSYDISPIKQLENLIDIIEFKKQNYEKVNLLLGNHDIHYWRNIQDKGKTSGFQVTMSFQYENIFMENERLFKICVLIGDKLCTHAGVSVIFLDDIGFDVNKENRDLNDIPDFLNDLFKYKPNEYIFSAPYKRGYVDLDDYGFNKFQSPIWIRPISLQRANKKSKLKNKFIQIVGHTSEEKIDIKGKSTGGRYYYIDTLSSGQYLIEENGILRIGQIILNKDF